MEENNQKSNAAESVGVRFTKAGRVYYFDPSDLELELGDKVVVETIQGLEMGEVVITDKTNSHEKAGIPIKPVIRKVTQADIERLEKLKQKENDALAECTRLIEKVQLPMKLISANYNIDGGRLTVSFSAESRVDFRELVRDLSRRMKVRVEMRQVGPRDEARLLGGYGRCGRQLCCASFLSDLNPVSIKMAKEQGLPLSPMKISGTCGRLLCCLGYEFEQYRSMKAKMPREGTHISTHMGEAIVVGGNPLEEKVMLEMESGVRVEMTLNELMGKNEDKDKQKDKDKTKNKEGMRDNQRRHSRKN